MPNQHTPPGPYKPVHGHRRGNFAFMNVMLRPTQVAGLNAVARAEGISVTAMTRKLIHEGVVKRLSGRSEDSGRSEEKN